MAETEDAVPPPRRSPAAPDGLPAEIATTPAGVSAAGHDGLMQSLAGLRQRVAPDELRRHVLVDTRGLLMEVLVHAADIQDRDGGVILMANLFGPYPFLLKLYADGGYQGPQFQQGLARVCRGMNVDIVRRCDTGKIVVLPKRRIVQRTIA